MPTILEFSTSGVDPADRLEFWCEGARNIGGLHHRAEDRDSFHGRASLAAVEDLRIGRIEVSAVEALWTHELIRCSDDGFLRFVLQCKGDAKIEQGDSRFILRPGHWTLLDASRPHTIRSEEVIEEIVMIVPRRAVSRRLFDANRHQAVAHPFEAGAGMLLFEFARSFLNYAGTTVPMVDEHLGAAGRGLVRAVLEERSTERVISTCRDIRLERIHAFIERNLSDPTLSVQTIADAMNCSKRYVHALFPSTESVHNLIWNNRLDKSARDLRCRDLLTTSITTIALSHGFSCPAHFSRKFRSRFGIPPRAYRERALDS